MPIPDDELRVAIMDAMPDCHADEWRRRLDDPAIMPMVTTADGMLTVAIMFLNERHEDALMRDGMSELAIDGTLPGTSNPHPRSSGKMPVSNSAASALTPTHPLLVEDCHGAWCEGHSFDLHTFVAAYNAAPSSTSDYGVWMAMKAALPE